MMTEQRRVRPEEADIEDVATNIDGPFSLAYAGSLAAEDVVRRWPGPHRTAIRLVLDRRLPPSAWRRELTRFRGREWAKRALGWKDRIPPIIVGSFSIGGRTVYDVFDGWGRTNYAMMTGYPLHVWVVRAE